MAKWKFFFVFDVFLWPFRHFFQGFGSAFLNWCWLVSLSLSLSRYLAYQWTGPGYCKEVSGMLTHIFRNKMSLLFAFKRCFFPHFLFTTSVVALNWFTFFCCCWTLQCVRLFSRLFLCISLSIWFRVFFFSSFQFHAQLFEKFFGRTFHLLECPQKTAMLEKVIISVMGKFLCI